MASEALIRQARSALEDERDDLRRRIEELATEDSELSYDENFADSGQVAAEQNEVQSLSASLQEQLDEVQRALTRIDEGEYGLCEVCGQPIQEERLEAVPAATLCIDHA
jgi:DnaK suppressor protein